MTISGIEYFSKSNRTCQGVFGVSAFPFSDRDVQHDGGPIGARWIHSNQEFVWHAEDKVSIYPSPDMQFLVVVFLRNPPLAFNSPHNALVLNADGSLRFPLRQPKRYAEQKTEFLDAWWYYCDVPQSKSHWWNLLRRRPAAEKKVRMKMLIGWGGDPNCTFEALDFDPETGEFGEVVDSGRL